MKQSKLKITDVIVFIFTLVLLGLQGCRIFEGTFKSDDWEHLASAWFIFNGYVPYLDYFQHHNPAWWYVLSPVFFVVKNPIDSFYVGRIISFLFFLGYFPCLWGIIKRLGGNGKVFLYTVAVYLSYPMSHMAYFQNRPDTPMIFFLLLGAYYWIKFYQEKHLKDIFICYLSFFISFAFLQKAVWILGPFGLYQVYLLYKKELRLKDVLIASVVPVLSMICYAVYLYANGMLLRYWELNYILNAHFFRDYRMYTIAIYDWIYGGLAVALIAYGLVKYHGLKRQLLCVLAGFMVIFLSVPKPYDYYWFIWTPFMSVVIGFWVLKIKHAFLRLEFLVPAFLTCILIFMRANMGGYISLDEMKHLTRIKTNDDEMITYGIPEGALFQNKPEHYYYMNLSRAAIWDRDLFHRYELPDWDGYIYKNKPKFIIQTTVFNMKEKPDWVGNEKLMGLDDAFLEKYYRLLYNKAPRIWERKELIQ